MANNNNLINLDELIKKNQNQNKIDSDFDILKLFTCWYLNSKEYVMKKDNNDNNQETNLITLWKTIPSTLHVQHSESNPLQILFSKNAHEFIIIFESFGLGSKSKQIVLKYNEYINKEKTIDKAMDIVKKYEAAISYLDKLE